MKLPDSFWWDVLANMIGVMALGLLFLILRRITPGGPKAPPFPGAN